MSWPKAELFQRVYRTIVVIILLSLCSRCQDVTRDPQYTDSRTPSIGVLYSSPTKSCFSEERIRSTLLPSLEVLWREMNHTRSVPVIKDVCDLVEAGVQGLITVLPHTQQTMVISQAEALHLPNLVIDLRPFRSPLDKDFSVLLSPSSAINSHMVKDILSSVGWTTATLVWDDAIGFKQRDEIHGELQRQLLHMHVFVLTLTSRNYIQMNPPATFLPRLNQQLIYIGRGHLWRKFVMQEMDILGDDYLWIVIADVTSREALESLKANVHANVIFVTQKWRNCIENKWNEQVEASQVDKHNQDNITILEEMLLDAIEWFSDRLPWENCPTNSAPPNCSAFHPSPLSNGCQVRDMFQKTEFSHRGKNTSADYEVFSSFHDMEVTLIRSGEWSATRGLVTFNKNLFLNAFHDFGDEPVLIASTNSPPFTEEVIENGRKKYIGFYIDVLNELADRMGFNYTIVQRPDNVYGGRSEDGRWTGMIGMVHRGETEMAIGLFTINSQREEVIDFTVPFLDGSTSILTLTPSYESNKSLFQTLKPYSAPVWICVLCSVIIAGVTSFLVNRFSPFQSKPDARPFQSKYESSLEDNLWMVYSSVTEQGIQHSPEAVSGRCLIGFWWLFTILLVATYTANLAAFLTVSLPPAPINSLRELADQDEIRAITHKGSSFWNNFRDSKSELYQKVFKQMQQSAHVTRMDDLMELVMTGKYARLGDKPLLDYLASNSCYALSVAGESFDPVGYGMVIRQGAPYARKMNHLLRKMQEAGLMKKWRHKWLNPARHCSGVPDDTANNLGLDSIGGLFLSYAGIIVLAVLCLVLEASMINTSLG